MSDVDESMEKSINEFSASFGPKTFATTACFVQKLDQKTNKRFNVVERDLEDLHWDQSAFQKADEGHAKAIQELQKAMAVAEACVPMKGKLELLEFNRQVDTTILRVNTRGSTSVARRS